MKIRAQTPVRQTCDVARSAQAARTIDTTSNYLCLAAR
eukprot:CAMPEP_0194552782 /NCGR_PEP_ID=MMETSP0253-20130528/96900_1 /TAXON_ID=2966 /ORGANISM="Noctiluca scintillans" /LENGTH=37 /DNA_ID= /DNA_START= /DNA_END= /DNA_ORIENTATION=